MSKPWLLFDSNFMAHRAHHSMGELSHEAIPTGTIFGFLKDVAFLMDQFDTDRTVFCWDYGRGKRREVCPEYKLKREQKREEATEEEREAYAIFQGQVRKLRDRFLRRLGFANVFFEPGYEGDDIIASVCRCLPPEDDAIIVSCDQDLWQCLRAGVRVYNPISKKMLDHEQFRAEWGVEPPIWAHVKAWAGCGTDEVVGLPGIGEKTAAKWCRGVLAPHTKAYQKISAGLETHNRNILLTRLPFPGCPEFRPRPDGGPRLEAWQGLCKALGMRALRELFPGRPAGIKPRNRTGFGI